MNRVLLFLGLFFVNFSAGLNAQALRLLLGGGIELGGDEVYELFFTNGDSSSGRAGQGGYLELGGDYQISQVPQLHIRGSVGFKFLLNPSENADTRITRFPVNVSGNWMINDDFRFGLGVSKHLGAKVVGDGFVEDRDFSSSIGPRMELAFKGITASYTIMKYTDQNNEKFSANAVGIGYSGTIGFNKKAKVPNDGE